MKNSGIVWYYLTEGRFFANRKEAKQYLGVSRFKRLLSERRIIGITATELDTMKEMINN